jgi:hypothetical protein
MILGRSTSPSRAVCLFLSSAVLFLGIIQWSFLPILVQNGPLAGKALLESSAAHTSKFAAPFKCFNGDGQRPCLLQARITVRRVASGTVHPPEPPISAQDEFSLSHRPLRSPPSV